MHGASALPSGHEGEGERQAFFISLGLGWTRCFFKMTGQLPKLSGAFHRFIPTSEIDRALWYSPAPPPCPPTRIQYWRGKGGVLISMVEQCSDPWGVKL